MGHRTDPQESGLSAAMIRDGLETRYIGQSVHYWATIDSTNDWLKLAAEDGAPEGTLAIADRQSAGRGRMRRKWEAPAGSSLLMSLLLRPTSLRAEQAQLLTVLCALAAADAVAAVTGLVPGLKWPNDLMLEGKKLAGVLTELGFGQPSVGGDDTEAGWDTLAWAVVGIGLNVNVDFSRQSDLVDIAVSLSMVLGRPVARLPILQAFLEGVERRYEALRLGESPHEEWAERLVTLGEQVTVTTADAVVHGVAEGIDQVGALLVRDASGRQTRILAGDVTLRKGGG
jgi:BirA family transcriptional regulator, biotin operon repressor / biotin---[acetyl-CoA-carboxylase] ligase